MSSYGPTGAPADAMEAAAAAGSSYRVCDTVVLVCLASASALIVLTVAFCFRRAFANGYAAAAVAANGAGPTAANGTSRCGLAPSALSAIPKARLPEGRRRRRWRGVGAVRDLPHRGAGRGDGAVAAGVRAPIPRRVHRPVAALSRYLPALPA